METRETKPVIFLFTFPLQGHLNPMFQLANIFFNRGFSITVIHTDFNSPDSSNFPDFTFVSIPDGLSESEASDLDIIEVLHSLNSKCVAPFGDCLKKLISKEPKAACVIVDALWYFTDGLTENFGIPRIVLRTVNISAFVAFSKFHVLREKGYLSLQESDSSVPELPNLRMKDLPWFQIEDPRSGDKLQIGVMKSLKSSSGIIFNAIEDLETEQLDHALKEFPVPLFSIGPFHRYVSASSSCSLLTQDMTCLSWLDKQTPNSVIYASIGSIAKIDESEFLEIAWGLRNRNQPFLWVVRPGSIHGNEWVEILPKGFIENLEGRGKIVKWSPQPEVLAHRATGGFLTHCGWNSTIEGICEAIPMICKPSFGDQRVNVRYISDVWKIGLHLENIIPQPASSSPSRLPQTQQSDSFLNVAPPHTPNLANHVPDPHRMDTLSWTALGYCFAAGLEFNAIFAQVANPNNVSSRVQLLSLLLNIALCLLIAANAIFARTRPNVAKKMDRVGSVIVLLSSTIAAMPTIPLYVSIGLAMLLILVYAHQFFFG